MSGTKAAPAKPSTSQANLIAVVTNVPREDALRMGQERALALVTRGGRQAGGRSARRRARARPGAPFTEQGERSRW